MPSNENRSVSNPLIKADFDKIRRNRQKAADIRDLIKRMENCGLDCTEHTQTLDMMEQYLVAIEREFFPNGKPD